MEVYHIDRLECPRSDFCEALKVKPLLEESYVSQD
jgi:hypothetical protein